MISVDSGAVVFGYDNNGNRVSRVEGGDTTTYDYDDDNRLISVDLPNDPTDVTMGYDASGARVWRAHGTDSTRYIAGMVEHDLDSTGTTGYRSLYGFGGTAVAVVDHTADTVVYPMGDHLGSIVASFDDTSNTVATVLYDPWGAERGGSGALPTDHRYTGQTSDTTTSASGGTGLLFYNARHYDPTIGAFTQADTIIPNPTTPATFNRYAYVTNNPTNHTDPSGHNPAVAACALSASGGPVSAGLVCGGAAILVGGLAVLAVIGAVGSSGPSIDDLKDTVRRQQEAAVGALAADIAASTTLDPADQVLILYAKPVDDPDDDDQEDKDAGESQGVPEVWRDVAPDFDNPDNPPGEGWVRNGQNWWHRSSRRSLHPDLENPAHGPHYDAHHRYGPSFRVFPDGRWVPK